MTIDARNTQGFQMLSFRTALCTRERVFARGGKQPVRMCSLREQREREGRESRLVGRKVVIDCAKRDNVFFLLSFLNILFFVSALLSCRGEERCSASVRYTYHPRSSRLGQAQRPGMRYIRTGGDHMQAAQGHQIVQYG